MYLPILKFRRSTFFSSFQAKGGRLKKLIFGDGKKINFWWRVKKYKFKGEIKKKYSEGG
jgi:hypothetical protein